jgi:Amt family ammonium transporter
LDTGSTAWLLAAAALVLIMTPGVGFFYGGMVRSSNAVSMIIQSLTTIGIVTVVWVGLGFSLAFGSGNAIIGGFDFAGLLDINRPVPGVDLGGIPPLAFVVFQMMFAIITPALFTGAGAERWRFGSMVLFVALWSLLVYAPVARWLFSPLGWAHQLGALDFAGGGVVHANAGAAALIIAASLGRRRGWPDPQMRPHSLPLVLLGASLLWFGWFGFNGGSALRANGIAALAFTNTQIAAATAMLAWALAERIRFGKATTLGAASGAVAGLVAITPAAGFVAPGAAIAIGALAGVICHLAVGLKAVFRLDDSLDVAAVHLVGGIVGGLCIGLFATTSVNAGGAKGLFYGGGYRLLGVQALALGAVVAYSAIMTTILLSFTNRILGNRAGSRDETVGLDLSQHGEAAYGPPATVRASAPAPVPATTAGRPS